MKVTASISSPLSIFKGFFSEFCCQIKLKRKMPKQLTSRYHE
ncbi:Hypothetical protein ABZS17D1_02956 [Kosakonia cowanii]